MLHVSCGFCAGFHSFSVTCSFSTKTFFLDMSSPLLCFAPLLRSVATLILATASAWLLSLHASSSWSHFIGESLVYCSTQSNSSFGTSNFMALIPILSIFQLIIFTYFFPWNPEKEKSVCRVKTNLFSHTHLAIQNNLSVYRCTAYLWKDFWDIGDNDYWIVIVITEGVDLGGGKKDLFFTIFIFNMFWYNVICNAFITCYKVN